MSVVRAWVAWPHGLAELDGALARAGCTRGRQGDDAFAAGEVAGGVRGAFLDRGGAWTVEDVALVRGLTRERGGFGAVVTDSSRDGVRGASLFFAGYRLAHCARGALPGMEGLETETPEPFDQWVIFDRWLREIGGPPLFELAQVAGSATHDRGREGVRGPSGPPPPSARILLFAPGDESISAGEALRGVGWTSACPAENLLIASGPELPPEPLRRSLAASHLAGAAWTLASDGPPPYVELLRDGELHPLPATAEGLLQACRSVAINAGWLSGDVAMPGQRE